MAAAHQDQSDSDAIPEQHNSKLSEIPKATKCKFMKDGNMALIKQTESLLLDIAHQVSRMRDDRNWEFQTSYAWNSDLIRFSPYLSYDNCPRHKNCPETIHPRIRIKVVNVDIVDVAVDYVLWCSQPICTGGCPEEQRALDSFNMSVPPVMITLDTIDSEHHHDDTNGTKPDCLHGSFLQRESLLVRTSLSLSSQGRVPHHPKPHRDASPDKEALYHPNVLVIRYDVTGPSTNSRDPTDWEIARKYRHISAITMATPMPDADFAYKRPYLKPIQRFPDDDYRNLLKARMRLSLRIAATHGHPNLLLGVLGNPARPAFTPAVDIARCWLEVLKESEFWSDENGGCWWRNVVVAVHDPNDEGWFDTFYDVMNGVFV
ncbi:hypothetical protein GE09DRAFT_1213402 [Coniochaeta sp. 2T2.1]|nr:hypothetical protein GE09DRAFT_1213402 [Coniochaeta sp. 2T2.1]